ncbi:MAG: stage III sporulation protein AB [Lachnospiraceae bacterium]|nr:hypothetical protein [Lachnospira sp.]MBR6696958.1 stage III sporulation protein AB [Lachnospiraceae bacterium]
MLLKLIGGCIVIGSGYLFGLSFSETYLKRIKELKLLRKNLLIITNHISYARMSLGEAMEEVALKSKEPFITFFESISKDINAYDSGTIVEIFANNAKKYLKGSNLTTTDIEKLIGFAEILGYLDADLQVKNAKLYLSELEADINELEADANGKCKVYKCLCTAVGIFITIIII